MLSFPAQSQFHTIEIKCPDDYPGIVNFKDWILKVTLAGK